MGLSFILRGKDCIHCHRALVHMAVQMMTSKSDEMDVKWLASRMK